MEKRLTTCYCSGLKKNWAMHLLMKKEKKAMAKMTEQLNVEISAMSKRQSRPVCYYLKSCAAVLCASSG